MPFDFHGQLIGQKGKEIRQIMDECGVTVAIPRLDERSDIIKIIGPPSKIDGARTVIEKRLHALEEERKQRVSLTKQFVLMRCWVFATEVFLQCSHIACNAERCNTYGNSVRPSVCPYICNTLVPYPDE